MTNREIRSLQVSRVNEYVYMSKLFKLQSVQNLANVVLLLNSLLELHCKQTWFCLLETLYGENLSDNYTICTRWLDKSLER